MRRQLIGWYLDYVNNYMTLSVFAEHNGLTEMQAAKVIELGKELHDSKHPEE